MGPYCNFCQNRCFVPFPRKTPEHILKAYGTSTIIATCPGGQNFEKAKIGYCFNDIVELLTQEEKKINHTPGPWRSERIIRDNNKRNDSLAVHPPHFYYSGVISKEDEANARLISAAPDLLETLNKIESWLVCASITTPEDMAQSFPDMLDSCSKAIAKVKEENNNGNETE